MKIFLTTFINEERKYRELKESVRTDIERKNLIKDGKRMDIDEIIWQNERINNSSKS